MESRCVTIEAPSDLPEPRAPCTSMTLGRSKNMAAKMSAVQACPSQTGESDKMTPHGSTSFFEIVIIRWRAAVIAAVAIIVGSDLFDHPDHNLQVLDVLVRPSISGVSNVGVRFKP